MKSIEELTLRFLDEELDEKELAELDELVNSDPAAREVFTGLLEQEGALRGLAADIDVSEATIERIQETLRSLTEEGVMRTIHERETRVDVEESDALPAEVIPIERPSPWLGRRAVVLALAAALLLVVMTGYETVTVRLEPVPEHEIHLVGQGNASPGKTAFFHAHLASGRTGEALVGANTRFRLVDDQGTALWEQEALTNEDGTALVEHELPASFREGSYRLEVEADKEGESLEVSREIKVRRSFRLFLSTDKPRYQPGQVIHIRSLALFGMDRRPVSEREIVVEVRDGRGNKVFNRRLETSDFGLAAADFRLADQVNMGEFTIKATIGDTSSERTVTVERYVLPRFRVNLTTERGYYAPGDTVTGELTARYTFGEPVANAKVRVVASEFVESFRPFETIVGRTDSEGRFPFELRLKSHFVGQPLKQGDAMVSFEAEVTDRADHIQKRTLEATVTTRSIRVDVVPESGEVVSGVDNVLYVVTSYPDGRPAPARVTVAQTGDVLQTDEAGFAEWIWRAGSPTELTLTAVDEAGHEARFEHSLRMDGHASEALLLRTDHALYRTGDTAHLTVFAAASTRRVFLDVVKDRQTVLTSAIDMDGGRGELALDLPEDLSGTLAITAYRMLSGGELVADTKLIQVSESEDLEIVAELDQETYRPADTATLQLRVLRGDVPTVAALSLWGVDEAVFALQESRPGLERVYFALQEELLEPRYEIHGRLQPSALAEPADPSSRGDRNAEVTLAAARGIAGPGRVSGQPYLERLDDRNSRLNESSRSLWGLLALSPSFLFIMLLLPLCGYGLWRHFRRSHVEGADPAEIKSMRWRLRWTIVAWVLGFYIPLTGAVGAAIVASYRTQGSAALIVGGGLWIVGAVMLFLLAWRVRAKPLSRAFPMLRRLVMFAPVAYLCLPLAIGALILDAESGRNLEEETVFIALAAIAAMMLLTVGALSSAGASVLGKLSFLRSLWVGGSRIALAGVPIFALFGLTLFTMGSASEIAGGDGEMEMVRQAAMFDQAAPRMLAPSPTKRTTTAAPLKAPSRVRSHFPETLFWRPEVITDEQGRATVEIPLADSITTWRVGIGAVTGEGLLGSKTVGVRVFQPFFVDLDLPVALTQNDAVQVRVAVYNYLDSEQTVRLDLSSGDWLEVTGGSSQTLNLAPREITQVSFPIVARRPGEHPLVVRAFGSEMADAVERRVRVLPDGQQIDDTRNGRLDEGLEQTITIPADAIDGANELVLKVYPGAFSQVIEGLDGILRMPNGCFEQTSSATYPNVLVLDYLRRNRQASPEVEMRALEYINVGYQRLLSFEVEGGGFEWFGQTPAHTVLTAYGLMEFVDMAEVYEVDSDVIARTRRWLLDQQRPNGSFEPTSGGIAEGAINAYQGKTLRTTAYIAWALGESGDQDARVNSALAYVESNIGREEDPYTLALAANALLANNRDANAVLRRLDGMKQEEDSLVHWSSTSEGVTHSRGNALDIETTALVAYAYQRARFSVSTAHAALAWLVTNKDSFGTWSSTQATIHAMRALLLGASSGGDLEEDLHLTVSMNGETVEELTITRDTADVFHTLVLSEHLRTGANQIRVTADGENHLAYQIVATHYRPWPANREESLEPLSIELSYDTSSLATGDLLTASATVSYNRPGTALMTIVDLGIPPGFELLTDSFETMRREDIIERYTVTERQVILYFREIHRGSPVSFSYRMRAEYPLRVRTPRSAAYQYYEPDIRDETTPVELTVR